MKAEFEITFININSDETKGATITASTEQNAVIKFIKNYGDFVIIDIVEK